VRARVSEEPKIKKFFREGDPAAISAFPLLVKIMWALY
jgi:hypothetical protein